MIGAPLTPESFGSTSVPLRLDVLGPVRLTVGGVEVSVKGARRRAALALLALSSGRVVGVDALVDALWVDPPSSGRHAVVSLMSRIRGQLGDFAGLLVRSGSGYQLAADGWLIDVDEVRALVRDARTLAPSDPIAAADRLRAALDRWRGEPLEEFDDFESLAAHAVGLRELRLAIEDEWLAAQLETGVAADLVEQTTMAVAATPLREQRQLIHIRALAQSGRTREALRAGHEYRQRLADEAGLDPTPALGELEQLVAGGGLEPSDDLRPSDAADERPGTTEAPPAPLRGDRLGTPAAPPRHLTGLYGRSAELAHLETLLEHERLVTLVGPGGIGKTRLVSELGNRLVARPERPVVYVALATLDDGQGASSGDIAGALAGAIGVRSSDGQTALAACEEWLGTTRAIVIFDNCEHVLDGARDVIDALSTSVTELSVITTSRVPTGLPGECVVRLGPLPPCRTLGDAELADAPAVQLFVARARRVTGASPSADELRTIADIVDRLDGVPLAIELAAARLSTLPLVELRRRLADALDLLADGRSTADARHRSLRATLDWSYRLLQPDERRLLAHLGAFTDGADLHAIGTIAQALGLENEAIAELAGLVDASIVLVDRASGTRYWMPEAVRAFAQERHRRHGGGPSPATTFLRWATSTAREIDELSRGRREQLTDRRLRTELGNIRSAHRAAIGGEEVEPAVAITVALDRVASFRDLPEIWSWARRLASHPAVSSHPELVGVVGAAAEAAWLSGDLDESERLARTGLEIDPGAGRCHYALATVALFRGDLDVARRSFLVAAEHDRTALANAALAAAYAGDDRGALALIAEGLSWADSLGSPTDVAIFEYATGETLGPSVQAADHYERSIELARHSGAGFVEGIASVGLASVLVRRGAVDEALALHRRIIRYWARTGNWTQQWITLRNVAALLRTLGEDDAAEVLESAATNAADPPRRKLTSGETVVESAPRSAAVGVALGRIDALIGS